MAQSSAALQEPLPSLGRGSNPAFLNQIGKGSPAEGRHLLTPRVKGRLKELRGLQLRIRKQLLEEGRTPQELATLTRAWDVLEARSAFLSGFGSPRPVPATNEPKALDKKVMWTDEGPEKQVIPGGKA